jgi:2-polyprenyl-6-methoxyphenol hydroxylase-like FAD-dependent oxidoreductase
LDGRYDSGNIVNGWVLTDIVADVPDPNKPEGWTFQLMPTWPGLVDTSQTDEERLSHLKEMAKDLAEPWKSAFTWIPEGSTTTASNLMYWATIPWDNQNGSVTLAGDAAHAMPPRMCSIASIVSSLSKPM